MISVPILAGAIMRFPLGVLAQYIGRKNAALTEMTLIFFAMLFGYYFVDTYSDVLKIGVLLGIAGIYAMQEYGASLVPILFLVLGLWILLPALAAYVAFASKNDL